MNTAPAIQRFWSRATNHHWPLCLYIQQAFFSVFFTWPLSSIQDSWPLPHSGNTLVLWLQWHDTSPPLDFLFLLATHLLAGPFSSSQPWMARLLKLSLGPCSPAYCVIFPGKISHSGSITTCMWTTPLCLCLLWAVGPYIQLPTLHVWTFQGYTHWLYLKSVIISSSTHPRLTFL